MGDGWMRMLFEEAININPQRIISCGIVAPHVSMDAIQPFTREIYSSEMKKFKGSGARFQNGDTLLARITPCLENGKTAFVSCLPEGSVGHGSTEFIVLSGKEGISDNLFVYYLSREPEFRDYAIQQMEGSTGRQRVPVKALTKLAVDLPPLPEQKAIASILGTLDDKIELNRKMNETLEAMARAIFKSWFVDFDLIPGFGPHKEGQDSPLGRIPKGWKVGTLSDLCEIVMGQSPPGETYNETGEGLPFYQGIRDFGFRFLSKRVYCTAPTRLAQKGDVLLSVRAPVGSLNVAGEDCAIGRGVAALRIKGQHYGFLYYLMRETQGEWEKYEAEGTVFGSATKTDVQNFSVIVPPAETILRFNKVVFPVDETVKNNEIQSLTLASIRDVLLPKLLSGEIRVKNADKFAKGLYYDQ